MLADDDGIFGSSMSDSTRAMVNENAEDILVVIYCFENNIDLDILQSEQRKTTGKKKPEPKPKGGQTYVVMWNLCSMFSRNHGSVCDCIIKMKMDNMKDPDGLVRRQALFLCFKK